MRHVKLKVSEQVGEQPTEQVSTPVSTPVQDGGLVSGLVSNQPLKLLMTKDGANSIGANKNRKPQVNLQM